MADNKANLPGQGGERFQKPASDTNKSLPASIDELPTKVMSVPDGGAAPSVADGATLTELPTLPETPAVGGPLSPRQEVQSTGLVDKQNDATVTARRGDASGAYPKTPLGKKSLVNMDGNRPGIADEQTIIEKSDFQEANTAPIQVQIGTPKAAPVIAVRDLTKTYGLGKKTFVHALRGVSLEVYPGEFVAILGPSGSGKSTFMNLIGCLDRPTKGEYWLAGKLVSRLTNDQLAGIRNQLIGFVFQGFNLLGRATAVSNAALPMVYAGVPKRERERRATKVLQLVGLGGRLSHKPPELSGGQQQRVAIARALVNGPAVLLADEPTGALDSRTSVEIMALLQALNQQGLTIVLVTHDLKVASYAKRQVAFLDGSIVRDEPVVSPRSAQHEWEELVKADVEAEKSLAVGKIKEEIK